MILHMLPAVVTYASFAAAQGLSVPSTWRDPNNTIAKSDRISIAQDAINTLTPTFNNSTAMFNVLSYWQGGNVFSAMANNDYITGNATNQAVVTQAINQAFSDYMDFDQYGYNDDAMWWATAAYYAYRAYPDSNLLNHAIATWNHVSTYLITPADAAAGSIPTKSFSIEPSCGASMVGGVFWRPVADDTSVNTIATGLYMTLSAFLANATGDPDGKYTNASESSATWLTTVNINPENLLLDTVNAYNCTRSPATELWTYNSGKVIEGLAVLSDITKNQTWWNTMIDIVSASTHTTAWQGSDGIIYEGNSTTADSDTAGFKSVLIRGLHEVWSRNLADEDLITLLRSYTDVQYNALLDLASTNSSGVTWYSPAWEGPAPTEFISWGQLAALDVLVSAIDMND